MTYPNLLDRFLTYVKVNTRSDEHSTTTPSTQSQVDFATNVLIPEMKRVGLQNVYYLPNGFAIGTLPANDPSLTHKIGFISHMDTADFNAIPQPPNRSALRPPRWRDNADAGNHLPDECRFAAATGNRAAICLHKRRQLPVFP